MKLINPAYTLNISSVNCQIEIMCNDVTIFEFKGKSSKKKGGISINIPLNHILLKNGEFEIRGIVFPIQDSEVLEDSSTLSIELCLMDYVAPKESLVSLLKLKTPTRSSQGIVKSLSNLPRYELYGKFKGEFLPFDEEGWTKSQDLSKVSIQKLLMDAYHFHKEIYMMINNKDIDSYLKLVESRDEIIQKTYYYDFKKIEDEKKEIIDIIEEPGLNLLPFNFEDVKLEFMGYNKLIRLVRKNNLPAIMFYNPLNKKIIHLNFKLHKKTLDSPLSII